MKKEKTLYHMYRDNNNNPKPTVIERFLVPVINENQHVAGVTHIYLTLIAVCMKLIYPLTTSLLYTYTYRNAPIMLDNY